MRQVDVKGLILESAVKLFEQYGYKNVTISQITDEINMTTGVFYYHFRSKEEILHTIYENYIDYVISVLQGVYELENVTAKEKLRLWVVKQCEIIEDRHSYVSVFFREYRNLGDDGLKMIRDKNSRFLRYGESIIEQGVLEGIFKSDLDPKMVSLAIVGMNNWLYQWYSPEGKYSSNEIAEIFFRLVGTGLLKD